MSKKYWLLMILACGFTSLHASSCPKCDVIREENAKKVYKYDYYEDYLKDQEANGKPDLKQRPQTTEESEADTDDDQPKG